MNYKKVCLFIVPTKQIKHPLFNKFTIYIIKTQPFFSIFSFSVSSGGLSKNLHLFVAANLLKLNNRM